jgi:hypothetical protein
MCSLSHYLVFTIEIGIILADSLLLSYKSRLRVGLIFLLHSNGLRSYYMAMGTSLLTYLSVFHTLSTHYQKYSWRRRKFSWLWTVASAKRFYCREQATLWRFDVGITTSLLYVHFGALRPLQRFTFINFLLQEKARQGDKLSFSHEAVVENWSSKDFNFTYSVSSRLVFSWLSTFVISLLPVMIWLLNGPWIEL